MSIPFNPVQFRNFDDPAQLKSIFEDETMSYVLEKKIQKLNSPEGINRKFTIIQLKWE